MHFIYKRDAGFSLLITWELEQKNHITFQDLSPKKALSNAYAIAIRIPKKYAITTQDGLLSLAVKRQIERKKPRCIFCSGFLSNSVLSALLRKHIVKFIFFLKIEKKGIDSVSIN